MIDRKRRVRWVIHLGVLAGIVGLSASSAAAVTGCEASASATVATPGTDSVDHGVQCRLEAGGASPTVAQELTFTVGSDGVHLVYGQQVDSNGDGDPSSDFTLPAHVNCVPDDDGVLSEALCSLLAQM